MPTFEINYYDENDEVCTDECEANDPHEAKRLFLEGVDSYAEAEGVSAGAVRINSITKMEPAEAGEPDEEPDAPTLTVEAPVVDDDEGAPV